MKRGYNKCILSEMVMKNFTKPCVWNYKKTLATFKHLFAVCGEPEAYPWQRLRYVIKNTVNGRYKEIEKEFQLPIDKQN